MENQLLGTDKNGRTAPASAAPGIFYFSGGYALMCCKPARLSSHSTPILLTQNCHGIRQMRLQAAALASLPAQILSERFALD